MIRLFIIIILDYNFRYYSKINNKEDESLLLLIGVYGDEQNNHHTHEEQNKRILSIPVVCSSIADAIMEQPIFWLFS